MTEVRCVLASSILAFAFASIAVAAEDSAATRKKPATTVVKRSVDESSAGQHWTGFVSSPPLSRIELPRRARVSNSRLPLRLVSLIGGDQFVGECLTWQPDVADFRLQTGQSIRPSPATIARIANPPNEVDLVYESFESDPLNQEKTDRPMLFDDVDAVDGRRSLRVTRDCAEFHQAFTPPITTARVEFWFRIRAGDSAADCGDWQLTLEDANHKSTTITVRVSTDRRIRVDGIPSASRGSSQTLTLDDGWHNFIGLISGEGLELIVDQAMLASGSATGWGLSELRFQSTASAPQNELLIDALQVRRLTPGHEAAEPIEELTDRDVVGMANDDLVFGQLLNVGRDNVGLEVLRQPQAIPWNQIRFLTWHQPTFAATPSAVGPLGVWATIAMQPFADRLDCPSERWNVTVIRSDSQNLVCHHPLLGELTVPWLSVRRVEPHYFGKTVSLDQRRFHLGNSIRPEFHRPLPDGTELRVDFKLAQIPAGRCLLALDVAEMEAAAPTAPPASPFLSELREQRLVTQVLINDQRVTDLNSIIRFKSAIAQPDRLRISIPRNLLKLGDNTIRLKQQPLNPTGNEFDDCEVARLHLEFDLTR